MINEERIHPGDRIASRQWQTPWTAWALAFRTRRSFGYAMAFGALSALCLIIVYALGIFTVAFLEAVLPLNQYLHLDFWPNWLIGAVIAWVQVFTYSLFVIYLGSRFVHPEVKPWGGMRNLRPLRSMLAAFALAGLASAFIWAVSPLTNISGNQSSSTAYATTRFVLLILPLIYIFQVALTVALGLSFHWPSRLQDKNTTLAQMLRHPSFHLNQIGLAMANWTTWTIITLGSAVAVGAISFVGAGSSSYSGILFFILAPLSFLIISGYSIFVFAAVAIAPFRVAGWTATGSENMAAVFE